jgi:hypothetical protein
MTTRQLTSTGLGRRTNLELSGSCRRQLNIPGTSREDYFWVRERWAQLTNHALEAAGLLQRVDHRGLAAQGVDREPVATFPDSVRYAERKSHTSTAAGDAIRARHLERVQARAKGPEELARVIQRQKTERQTYAVERAQERQAQPRKRWGSLTKEERSKVQSARYRERIQKLDAAGLERKREAAREASRRWRAAHPEAARKAVMQWRSKHPEERNRLSREYYHRNAVEISRKRHDHRVRRAAEQQHWMSHSRTAEDSLKVWQEYREKHGIGPTPEQSVRNWVVLRERQERELAAAITASKNDLERSAEHDQRVQPRDHGLEL